MSDDVANDNTNVEMTCPKDGSTMEAFGRRRRSGAYRCPTCQSVFLDVATLRQGRASRPPAWAPVLVSVLMSVGMTLLVRRLRRGRRCDC